MHLARMLFFAIFFAAFPPVTECVAATKKPNVLLIVLDDAGYSDVAGFGRNDAPTPNIKKLADEGVRFTRHYADSTCRPARLALMTGRESARVAQNPDFRGMSPHIITLAEALKNNGYSTHHVGKWHLGDAVRESWPDQQGFDSWFGFLNQFQLKGPDKNGKFTKRPTYSDPWLQGDSAHLQQYHGHLEDILADRVVEKIAAMKKELQPWFINYWLFAPHHPSQASEEFLKKFPATPEGKYRALLAQADAEVGKAVKALRDSQQLDNTLIVVTSDNGGTNQMTNNNAPFAGVKGGFQEGSLRTPLIIRWPNQQHAGESRDDVVAIQDVYPTILAAANIELTDGHDGQNLHVLLEGKKLKPRVLTHEMATAGAFHLSVLSDDAHWRLSDSSLYDLESDPASAVDSAETWPTKQKVMAQQYANWRAEKIQLDLTRTTLSDNGRARMTGDDLRRAPGYGAFNFSVDVYLPKKNMRQAACIAEQKSFWLLQYNPDHTFTLQMGEQKMISHPLPALIREAGHFTLKLDTLYTRSRLHEGRNNMFIELYADGQKLLHWQQANPEEISGNYAEPTFIGQCIDGSAQWPGSLGVAYFYNGQPVDFSRMGINTEKQDGNGDE
jgi:arylsulfatase A-like enzyme